MEGQLSIFDLIQSDNSECDDYKEFCRINEEERQKIQAGRNKTSAHDSYIRDSKLKIEKRERGKK